MIIWTRTKAGEGADLLAEDVHAEEKDGMFALWLVPFDGDPVMLTERLSTHDDGHPVRVYDAEDRIIGWEWDVYTDPAEDEEASEFPPEEANFQAGITAIGSAFEMLGQIFGFQLGRIAGAMEAIQATLEHAFGKVYPEGMPVDDVKREHEAHKRPVATGYQQQLVMAQMQALAMQQEVMKQGVIHNITDIHKRRNQ